MTGYKILLVTACLNALIFPASEPAIASESFGTWQNPTNSVHIKIVTCGDARCGVVVWANAKAKADSRKGGTQKLVGTTLLKDFRETSNNQWTGKAYVPDIGKQFSGTATIVNARTIIVEGCLVSRIGCKSQTWTRID